MLDYFIKKKNKYVTYYKNARLLHQKEEAGIMVATLYVRKNLPLANQKEKCRVINEMSYALHDLAQKKHEQKYRPYRTTYKESLIIFLTKKLALSFIARDKTITELLKTIRLDYQEKRTFCYLANEKLLKISKFGQVEVFKLEKALTPGTVSRVFLYSSPRSSLILKSRKSNRAAQKFSFSQESLAFNLGNRYLRDQYNLPPEYPRFLGKARAIDERTLTLPLVPGVELTQYALRLRGNKPDKSKMLDSLICVTAIYKQVIAILRGIHDVIKITHGDLSHRNIFIESLPNEMIRIWLIDFGESQPISERNAIEGDLDTLLVSYIDLLRLVLFKIPSEAYSIRYAGEKDGFYDRDYHTVIKILDFYSSRTYEYINKMENIVTVFQP